MFYGVDEKNIKKCPMCHRVVIKLIPLYEHDQSHKLTLCCKRCKKSIKTGTPVKKYEGEK